MDFRFLECSRILSLGSASRELGLFGLYLQLMLLLLLLLLLPLAACWPPESLGALVFVFGHRAPSHLVLFFGTFNCSQRVGKLFAYDAVWTALENGCPAPVSSLFLSLVCAGTWQMRMRRRRRKRKRSSPCCLQCSERWKNVWAQIKTCCTRTNINTHTSRRTYTSK